MNTVTRNLIRGIVKRAGGYIYEVGDVTNMFLPSLDTADNIVTSLHAIVPHIPIDRFGCQITITDNYFIEES